MLSKKILTFLFLLHSSFPVLFGEEREQSWLDEHRDKGDCSDECETWRRMLAFGHSVEGKLDCFYSLAYILVQWNPLIINLKVDKKLVH